MLKIQERGWCENCGWLPNKRRGWAPGMVSQRMEASCLDTGEPGKVLSTEEGVIYYKQIPSKWNVWDSWHGGQSPKKASMWEMRSTMSY